MLLCTGVLVLTAGALVFLCGTVLPPLMVSVCLDVCGSACCLVCLIAVLLVLAGDVTSRELLTGAAFVLPERSILSLFLVLVFLVPVFTFPLFLTALFSVREDELVNEFLDVEAALLVLELSLFCSSAYLFVALAFLLLKELSGCCLS